MGFKAGKSGLFNREGSTLGVMDDLQFALHTYDGCARGCPGCVVDKHFKNKERFRSIMPEADLRLAHTRMKEYFNFLQDMFAKRNPGEGYFGPESHALNHYSATFRFGNHSELPADELEMIISAVNAPFKVFSTAPAEEISKFAALAKKDSASKYFLEIIYDPVADKAIDIRRMILEMRSAGVHGYPEVLITRRLLNAFSPERFADEALGDLADLGIQLQIGRFSPARSRNWNVSQLVPLDEEVEWLTKLCSIIIGKKMKIHPIPLGEYAVTFLDEYGEDQAWDGKTLDLAKLPAAEPFNQASVKDKTRDIFLTSLYIDHNLDLFVWAESMGQHALERNFGFEPLGNLRAQSIGEIVTEKNGGLEKMLSGAVRELAIHPKCAPCRYKSFCASHAVPFFRRWHQDSGKHCYGYLPVIREFQKNPEFLSEMVDGFKMGF